MNNLRKLVVIAVSLGAVLAQAVRAPRLTAMTTSFLRLFIGSPPGLVFYWTTGERTPVAENVLSADSSESPVASGLALQQSPRNACRVRTFFFARGCTRWGCAVGHVPM